MEVGERREKQSPCSLIICSKTRAFLFSGNMYFPPPWHNSGLEGSMISADINTAQTWMVTKWWKGVTYSQPEDICIDYEYGNNYRCTAHKINGGRHDWSSNYTLILGEPTLPRDMVLRSERQYQRMVQKRHPWAAPGSATVFGNGCGVNGGNPQGCWGNDPFPYGHCCVVKYVSMKMTCIS